MSVTRLRTATDAAERGARDAAFMNLTASARSVPGRTRQDVLIDGRHHFVTDEPVHLGGDDLGPAPHELLPAALAACISTTLVTYARTKKWNIGQVAVDVAYDHKAVPRRFDVAISVDGPVDSVQLSRLEKVASACPLRRALETGFEFHEDFRHPQPKGGLKEKAWQSTRRAFTKPTPTSRNRPENCVRWRGACRSSH